VLDLTRMVQHCVQKVATTFSKACVAAAKHQATQKVKKMERSSAIRRERGAETRSITVSPAPELLVKRRAARERATTIPESGSCGSH
jgi:hypothetical protein